MSNLIIFDLDGVVTSEAAYWDAAGLTLHELLYSPRYWGADGEYYPPATAEESRRVSRKMFPESEILALKARAINSNWDTCYVTICLHLIGLLSLLKESLHELPVDILPLQPWDADWMAAFRRRIATDDGKDEPSRPSPRAATQGDRKGRPYHTTIGARDAVALGGGEAGVGVDFPTLFNAPIFHGYIGLELINRFDAYASEALDYLVEGVFSRYSPFWAFCRTIFQEWYLGDGLYMETYGHGSVQSGKSGCIHFEQPLLPVERVQTALEMLSQQGYILGFATGRVYQEAVYPLKMYGLLRYFDEQHISTYDDVEHAEAGLRIHGDQTLLSKPHPFPFLVAADSKSRSGGAARRDAETRGPRGFVVVGDSTSDILGGHAAGALTVAVLTGAYTPEARDLLAQSNPDFTIEDITKLPALLLHVDSLATIQRLQFTEREKAERLLQRWFMRHMQLPTERVTLVPRAVSLNSFNGFYYSDGTEYFFKTHVEEQGVIAEYYHAEMLHQAGYNIVRPLRTLHEEGRQMVIYPVVRWPVMFDLVRAVETGIASDVTLETLVLAEQQECERLLDVYRATLVLLEAGGMVAQDASIHQLFWHRLTGGRFGSFYMGKNVLFPGDEEGEKARILFDELLRCHWVINGVAQPLTLGELVERAQIVLHPARAAATVIGHGDAHFGNVFLEDHLATKRYLYFDPAFAGRHSPLLDVVKPLFHNVFATWMYFPQDVAQNLQMSVSVHDATLRVEHGYVPTPVRQAILQTKVEHLIMPLIEELRSQDALPADWLEIMRLALMCCPLLTINLLDGDRLPSTIGWLGLSQAVQLGNSGIDLWRSAR